MTTKVSPQIRLIAGAYVSSYLIRLGRYPSTPEASMSGRGSGGLISFSGINLVIPSLFFLRPTMQLITVSKSSTTVAFAHPAAAVFAAR